MSDPQLDTPGERHVEHLCDSGVDIPSEEETQQQDNYLNNETATVDAVAMGRYKPAPKPCLSNKVDASNDVTRQSLYSSTQQVIDDLNSKRKQDTQLLADFKKTLEQQVVNCCNRLQKHLFGGYDKKGELIQQKLQDLYMCLDRIEKIETELHQFKESLKVLYQDMHRE